MLSRIRYRDIARVCESHEGNSISSRCLSRCVLDLLNPLCFFNCFYNCTRHRSAVRPNPLPPLQASTFPWCCAGTRYPASALFLFPPIPTLQKPLTRLQVDAVKERVVKPKQINFHRKKNLQCVRPAPPPPPRLFPLAPSTGTTRSLQSPTTTLRSHSSGLPRRCAPCVLAQLPFVVRHKC